MCRRGEIQIPFIVTKHLGTSTPGKNSSKVQDLLNYAEEIRRTPLNLESAGDPFNEEDIAQLGPLTSAINPKFIETALSLVRRYIS